MWWTEYGGEGEGDVTVVPARTGTTVTFILERPSRELCSSRGIFRKYRYMVDNIGKK